MRRRRPRLSPPSWPTDSGRNERAPAVSRNRGIARGGLWSGAGHPLGLPRSAGSPRPGRPGRETRCGGCAKRSSTWSLTCASWVSGSFQRAGPEESRIFDAQILMAQDKDFLASVETLIRKNQLSAETAYEFKALELRAPGRGPPGCASASPTCTPFRCA